MDQHVGFVSHRPYIKQRKTSLVPDPQKKKSTPQLNQVPLTTRRGMWMDEALEISMDVVEGGMHSLKRANMSWNIPMSSLYDHMNGKSKSRRMGPGGVLIEEKDSIMIGWTLIMQECGLSISLQQPNMKFGELT
jgi:hypothetical protein